LSNVNDRQGEYVEEIPDGGQRIGDPPENSKDGVDDVVDQGQECLEKGIHAC